MNFFYKLGFELIKKTEKFFVFVKKKFLENSDISFFKRFLFFILYKTTLDKAKADLLGYLGNNELKKAHDTLDKIVLYSTGLSFREKQVALDVAIFKNNENVVKFLIEQNVDVNYPAMRNRMHELPLSLAMRLQHYNIVDILLDAGSVPELFHCQKEKFTALHYACMDGNVEYMDKLLRKKADLNRQTDMGHTALFYAVTNSHRKLVYRLIEEGAQLFPLRIKRKLVKDKNSNFFKYVAQCFSFYYSILKKKDLCYTCTKEFCNTSKASVLKFATNRSVNPLNMPKDTISCCSCKSQLKKFSSHFSDAIKAELMVELAMMDYEMSCLFQKAFNVDINANDEDGASVVVKFIKINNIPKLKMALTFSPSLNNFTNIANSPLLCALNKNDRQSAFIIASASGNHFPKILHSYYTSNIKNRNPLEYSPTKYKKEKIINEAFQSVIHKKLKANILSHLTKMRDGFLSLLLYHAGFPGIQLPIPISPHNPKLHFYNDDIASEWLRSDGRKVTSKKDVDRVMSLQGKCRIVIRKTISDSVGGAVVSTSLVQRLPIPPLLQRYILLHDLIQFAWRFCISL